MLSTYNTSSAKPGQPYEQQPDFYTVILSLFQSGTAGQEPCSTNVHNTAMAPFAMCSTTHGGCQPDAQVVELLMQDE